MTPWKWIPLALAAALGLVLGLAWFVGRDVGVPEVTPLAKDESPAVRADAQLELKRLTPGDERTAIVSESSEPSTSIDGIVTDRAGLPIAGATVELYESPPGLGTSLTRALATTDAEGRFSLAGEISFLPEAGVLASAPGFHDESTEPSADRSVLVLRLTRPTAVFGRVLDAETGAPIPEATVQRYGYAASVRSDANGRYRVEGLHLDYPGELVVTKDGYMSSQVQVRLSDESPHELDVELAPDMPREVLVFDRDSGRPIVDAEVRWSGRGKHFARTDEHGRFGLRIAVGLELHIEVTAPGCVPLDWIWRVESLAGLEDGVPHRIPMWRWAFIEGHVRDAEGRPVAGCIAWSTREEALASLALTAEERSSLHLPGHLRYEARARDAIATDAEGRYTMPVVPSSEPQSVTFHHRDHASLHSASVVLASGGCRASVDAVLNAGGTVRGRAVHDGKPWRHEVAWQLGELGGKARVRGDGSFELRNVPAGEVRVFANRHASAPLCEARVLVEADSLNFVELMWD